MRIAVDAEVRAALAAEEQIGPPTVAAVIDHVLARPSAALSSNSPSSSARAASLPAG